MQQDQNDKTYPSQFDPSIKTDISNYLTEILISNFLKWQKKPIPQSPFWRKDISTSDKWLKELSKKYQVELSGVKNLLTVFSPKVLAEDFSQKNRIGVVIVKKETQKQIIFDLYQSQLKYNKGKTIVSEKPDAPILTSVQSQMPKNKKISKLL